MTAIKNGTLLVKDSNGNTARVATLSQTDITTLNTALTDIDANKKRISSISANYVTTNTAQTITGKKTLSTTNKAEVIAVKVTNTDNTVTPTEDLWTNVISVYDKNHINVGNLQFARYPSGSNWISLQPVNKNSSGNAVYESIGVGIGSDGTASTYAPNPASNSNDTSIATTSWVNSKISSGATSSNKVVTIDTAQTISGAKTFTNAIIAPDIELTAPYPFIDFHFNNSTTDFTSRIIAEANAYLHCSGTFAADAFKSLSDKNYKKDITSVSYDLSKLKSYRYKFKNDKSGSWYVGLIAQEVQEIIPEAVTKTETKDGDYLTLDYNAIVAALVTEVNQLKKRIEVLENK